MIGIDIIDRQAIRPRTKAHQERYRQKIFSDSEMALLAPFREKDLDIWIGWAAKESCYKLHFQIHPQRALNPKKFQIKRIDTQKKDKPILFCVQKNEFTFQVTLEVRDDFILALAANRPFDEITYQVFVLPGSDWEEQSHFCYKKLHTQCDEQFGRGAYRVNKQPFPHAVHSRSGQQLSCSISHHGRWGASALLRHQNKAVEFV